MGMKARSLNEVFERHYPAMVAWCRGHVRRWIGDPEEFVHLAYLRCRQSWSPQLQSRHNEAAYLYRALRWVVWDACRRHLRQVSRTCSAEHHERPPLGLITRTLIAREAIGLLRGKQLQVCLAVMAGKDDSQIRKELNLTSGALAVHLSRAKARLCRFLDVDGRHPRAHAETMMSGGSTA